MRNLFRTILILFALAGILPVRAQFTSIVLSTLGGGLVSTLPEESREISLQVVTPSHSEILTVDYRVYAGTAQAGADFIASTGTLTFQTNEQSKTFTVRLIDDALVEGAENFFIELTNASPAYPIFRPVTSVTIIDDEVGYISHDVTAREDVGMMQVPIERRGDFNIASSVEIYLEPDTAVPGRDYVDETFTVNFAPYQTVTNIQIAIINNSVEDGDRAFRLRLRNPTGGVPANLAASARLTIQDNELGYAFRLPPRSDDLFLYEGGPEKLILERRGNYDIRTVATVTAAPLTNVASGWLFPPAEAGVDFIGSEFQVEFAPGQTFAEVPIAIVNDVLAETREWIQLQYTTNTTTPGLGAIRLSIRDNEFNPLPVRAICPSASEQIVTPVTPLRDGKFLVASSDSYATHRIHRYTAAGELDPTFAPIELDGATGKMIEGPDGKYTISIYRYPIQDYRLERYLPTGQRDETFNPAVGGYLWDFEVASNGKVYVPDPVRRLNNDGSVDDTFAVQAFSTEYIVLDSAENVYVRNSLNLNWIRLTPAGAIDPTFSLTQGGLLRSINGSIFAVTFDFGVTKSHRLTNTGASDPTFTTIAGASVEGAPAGKLYALRAAGSEVFVELYNADGTPDPTRMRATFDIKWEDLFGRYAMRPDGTGLVAYTVGLINSINGTSLVCGSGPWAIADIQLDIPPHRGAVEPGTNILRERDDGGNVLTFIRTGDNSSSSKLRYAVRSGSALSGQRYVIADQGEINFEPGASRAIVPITVVDNATPEADGILFVDILNDAATIQSTTPFTIRNEDVGIQILGREGNIMRIAGFGGEQPKFILMRSSDLITWDFQAVLPNGVPLDIDLTGDSRFFWGRSYTGN
jgi:hypothetical protein